MLLNEAKGIWWWSIMMMHHLFLVCQSLSIWTCRSLLCSSRSKTSIAITLIRSNTTSTSCFVCFLRSMASWGYLSPAYHLSWTWSSMIVVHFVFKWSGSHWSTSFENAKLLIEDLWVGKSLILSRLSKVIRTHYLLRHHQIVCLRSIYSFLALNRSNSVAWRLDTSISNLTDVSNSTYSGWHPIISWWKLLDCSWPIWVFTWYFRTVTFQSDHAATDTHNGLLIVHITLIILALCILILWCHLTAI